MRNFQLHQMRMNPSQNRSLFAHYSPFAASLQINDLRKTVKANQSKSKPLALRLHRGPCPARRQITRFEYKSRQKLDEPNKNQPISTYFNLFHGGGGRPPLRGWDTLNFEP